MTTCYLAIPALCVYRGAPFDVQEDSDVVLTCIVNALSDSDGPAKTIGWLWDIAQEDRIRCLHCNTV